MTTSSALELDGRRKRSSKSTSLPLRVKRCVRTGSRSVSPSSSSATRAADHKAGCALGRIPGSGDSHSLVRCSANPSVRSNTAAKTSVKRFSRCSTRDGRA